MSPKMISFRGSLIPEEIILFVCRSQIIVIYLLGNATTIIFTQLYTLTVLFPCIQVLVCGMMVAFKDQIRGEESNKITDRESSCE